MSIEYKHNFLRPDVATKIFEQLPSETAWKQFKGGFGHARPRKEAWYGDMGVKYASYNKGMEPLPWTDTLASLRERVSDATGATFNGVLLNLYRNEKDSVAPHADDEPEFGINPLIASVSLGASRRFVLRHNDTGETRTIELVHGSLLVMAGTTQAQYKTVYRRRQLPERSVSISLFGASFFNRKDKEHPNKSPMAHVYFLAALIFAQRAFCASAIFLRAAADHLRFGFSTVAVFSTDTTPWPAVPSSTRIFCSLSISA